MSGAQLDNQAAVPLVSVVIPTYNQAQFLGETIQSALDQTYLRTEIIVVDNSSTDDTRKVIDSFGSQIVAIRQPNEGPSSARNRGVQIAQGEFITFVDGDDILRNDCVAVRVGMLMGNDHAGLVVGAFNIVDADRNVLWQDGLSGLTAESIPIETMLATMYGPTCGMAVRKEVYESIGGFDPDFRIAEDCDFAIRMAATAAVLYDSEPRAEYRQAGSSLSRNYRMLYDSYRRMAQKNQDLMGNRDRYWSIVGPHVRGRLANLIFGKLFKERKLGALPSMASLMLHRPSSVSCFGTWLGNAIRNRLPASRIHLQSL